MKRVLEVRPRVRPSENSKLTTVHDSICFISLSRMHTRVSVYVGCPWDSLPRDVMMGSGSLTTYKML